LQLKSQTYLKEKDIVLFLGRHAIWFADRIYQEFNPVDDSLRKAMNGLAEQTPDKMRQLDEFLGEFVVERQPIPEDPCGIREDDEVSVSSDGDANFDGFDIDDAEFPNISLVRQFLLEGTPFQNLKEKFRQFIYKDRSTETNIIPAACEEPRDASAVAKPSAARSEIRLPSFRVTIHNFIRTLLRPRIPEGHQRITWTCVSLLTDVGVEIFEDMLTTSTIRVVVSQCMPMSRSFIVVQHNLCKKP
jgi:hypothetical protein